MDEHEHIDALAKAYRDGYADAIRDMPAVSLEAIVGQIMSPNEIRKYFCKVPNFGKQTIEHMLDALDDGKMKICRKDAK